MASGYKPPWPIAAPCASTSSSRPATCVPNVAKLRRLRGVRAARRNPEPCEGPQMRFELFIATRYLRAKRRQAFIGIITGISIVGVAAGVASLIVALAINNGFRQDLQERLIGSTSHVSLLRIADDGIKDWPPLLNRLSKQPHVVAAAPAIFEQVLISRGPRARGAVLKGMIPSDERKVGDLLSTIKEGSASALDETSPTSSRDLQKNETGTNPTADNA